MKKFLFIILGILIIGSGVVYALNSNSDLNSDSTNKKILIAYYSRSGNTKSIAQKIQSQVKGDMFEIKTKNEYPSDYTQMTQIAKQEQESDNFPKLQSYPENIQQYEVIFIGTPVWWGKMANPVKTFLSNGDLKGKTVVPFITHGGGGEYSIAKDMEKITGAKVKAPLILYEKGGFNAQKEITDWLKTINY